MTWWLQAQAASPTDPSARARSRGRCQGLDMRRTRDQGDFGGSPVSRRLGGVPDLHSQFEELLVEVWRQEDFERRHPFTCGVIREASRETFQPSRQAA